MSVPALRFKQDDGREFPKWEATTLNAIAKIVGGGTPDTAIEDYWQGSIQWFTPTELKTKYVSESKRKISDAGLKNSSAKVLPAGTLLLSSRATVGDVSIALNECTTNQGFQSLIVNDENNNEFVYYWLTNNKKSLLEKASGSTFLEISKREIEKLVIQKPVKKEQTKIANFLTTVDEKISLLTQKYDLLTQYKKGVMQKIFSQELRFKDDDGRDFPEWEDEALENLLDYEQPTKYLVSSTEYSDDYNTPVLTAGKTFILGYTNETNGICEQDLPVIIFDDFTTAFKFVPFPFKAKSSAMKILRKKAGVNISYIYSAMQLIDFPSGDEHKRYWISEYSKVTIPLPCQKEQTKIANFLTAIDDKITATQAQLHAVKQYKQGLLQQMFV